MGELVMTKEFLAKNVRVNPKPITETTYEPSRVLEGSSRTYLISDEDVGKEGKLLYIKMK